MKLETLAPYAVTALFFVFFMWLSRRKQRRPQRLTHEGQTYFRQSNGTFTNSTGAVVSGALMLGALGTAYEVERRRRSETGDTGGSGDGGWFSSGDSGSDSGGGHGGGGDSGGGGDGGGD